MCIIVLQSCKRKAVVDPNIEPRILWGSSTATIAVVKQDDSMKVVISVNPKPKDFNLKFNFNFVHKPIS